MKHFLSCSLVFTALAAFSQPLYWTPATDIADGLAYGNLRPRIAMAGGTPVVLWSKSGTGIFFSRHTGAGTFSEPVRLDPQDVEVFTASYGGSDMAARGNRISVVFMTEPYMQAKLYLLNSSDGGQHWSDTVAIPVAPNTIPFLPTIALDEQANPTITYMEYDQNYNNPKYVVVTSTDGGLSFGPPVSASHLAPHEVCDCCPAHVLAQADTTLVLFRNNDQNIRDMWISLSHDAGDTFAMQQDIDPNGWVVASCPSSGPDALLSGGLVSAVWMSGGGGEARIYGSLFNPATAQFTTNQLYNGGISQNHPRIAGSGDTVAVVFQNTEGAHNNCLFGYSLSGLEGVLAFEDIARDSASLQTAPDIAFHRGVFHIVYRDVFSGNVRYRSASFEDLSAVAENPAVYPDLIYPNPVQSEFYIRAGEGWNGYKVFDAHGNLLFTGNGSDTGPTRVSMAGLPGGLYLVVLSGVAHHRSIRVLKQ